MVGGGTNGGSPRRAIRWLRRTLVVFGVSILVLAGVGVAVGDRLGWSASEPPKYAFDAQALPDFVPTDSVELLRVEWGWPHVVEARVEVEGATSLYLIDPDDDLRSRLLVPTPIADDRRAIVEVDGEMLDVPRGTPVSILPATCANDCTLMLRMLDVDGVYLFSDGDLEVARTRIDFVPTEIVRTIPIEPAVDWEPTTLVDVCVTGVVRDTDDPFERFVTLQQRRPDQVGPTQFSLRQGWPVVPSVSDPDFDCDVEHRVRVQTWGRGRDSGSYAEVVVNVVYWGQTPLDDASSITATASVVQPNSS